MADDDYWNESAQVGYDFGESDDLAVRTSGINDLGAEVKRTVGFDDFEVLNFGGFDDFTEIKTTPSVLEESKKFGFKLQGLNEATKICTPQRTIINMLLSLPYCLEQHKGKDEKIALLEAAIKSHDGNAITAAVLFLKGTLKKSSFYHELLKRPEAVSHYLYYLQNDHGDDELSNMLLMMGKTEDAAMVKYRQAVLINDPSSKIKRLQNCLSTHFLGTPVAPYLSTLVSEHVNLLQWQHPIEEFDAKQELEKSSEIFEKFPRFFSLVDKSVIETLFYCCFYHYSLPENNFASPMAVRKAFQLTEKQFMWTSLSALAKLEKWSEIDKLFQSKSWLGGVKMKCCIGFHKVAEVLHGENIPVEIIGKYVSLLENTDDRLEVAKKFKCHHLVVETLILMKDRQGLINYKQEILPHTLEYYRVEDALNTSGIKWKN